MWYVYILECKDKTFYTGIAKNIEKRMIQHNSGKLGAKYTRGRRPVKLVYFRKFITRSVAQVEEYRIKKLSRNEKRKIVSSSDIQL